VRLNWWCVALGLGVLSADELAAHEECGLAGALAFVGICLVAARQVSCEVRGRRESGLGRLDNKEPVPYFIADGHGKTGYRASDRQLALWALQAWQRSAGGTLRFRPSAESDALVRVYFANPDDEDSERTAPFRMDGKRGAAVYIRPDLDSMGPDLSALAKKDDLLRETIVYLTCLHELGHALGLDHTRDTGISCITSATAATYQPISIATALNCIPAPTLPRFPDCRMAMLFGSGRCTRLIQLVGDNLPTTLYRESVARGLSKHAVSFIFAAWLTLCT